MGVERCEGEENQSKAKEFGHEGSGEIVNGEPNLTTETRRHGENRIRIYRGLTRMIADQKGGFTAETRRRGGSKIGHENGAIF